VGVGTTGAVFSSVGAICAGVVGDGSGGAGVTVAAHALRLNRATRHSANRLMTGVRIDVTVLLFL
jgi:hypothetical protein